MFQDFSNSIYLPQFVGQSVYFSYLSPSVRARRARQIMQLNVGEVLAPVRKFGRDPGQALHAAHDRERTRAEHDISEKRKML